MEEHANSALTYTDCRGHFHRNGSNAVKQAAVRNVLRRPFLARLLAACFGHVVTRAAAQQPAPTVKDFGAVGDGVNNDLLAIRAAFMAGKTVRFPAGTYFLGSAASPVNLLDLSGLGAGITIITKGVVELVVETTENVMPRIFYLQDNANLRCGAIRFRDRGYSRAVTWRGAIGFFLDSAPAKRAKSWGEVHFESIHANSMVAAIICAGAVDAAYRVRGIWIGEVVATDCYYGVNCQNQGDDVVVTSLTTDRCVRPYFVYGVSDHAVSIVSRANRPSTGAVNISRSVGGLDTKRLKIKYVNRDTILPGVRHANFNHIDLRGGVISDIQLHVDIRSSAPYEPVAFINYSGSGGEPDDRPSMNEVRNVTLSGTCDERAEPVKTYAMYASKHRLIFKAGPGFVPDATLRKSFQLE